MQERSGCTDLGRPIAPDRQPQRLQHRRQPSVAGCRWSDVPTAMWAAPSALSQHHRAERRPGSQPSPRRPPGQSRREPRPDGRQPHRQRQQPQPRPRAPPVQRIRTTSPGCPQRRPGPPGRRSCSRRPPSSDRVAPGGRPSWEWHRRGLCPPASVRGRAGATARAEATDRAGARGRATRRQQIRVPSSRTWPSRAKPTVRRWPTVAGQRPWWLTTPTGPSTPSWPSTRNPPSVPTVPIRWCTPTARTGPRPPSRPTTPTRPSWAAERRHRGRHRSPTGTPRRPTGPSTPSWPTRSREPRIRHPWTRGSRDLIRRAGVRSPTARTEPSSRTVPIGRMPAPSSTSARSIPTTPRRPSRTTIPVSPTPRPHRRETCQRTRAVPWWTDGSSSARPRSPHPYRGCRHRRGRHPPGGRSVVRWLHSLFVLLDPIAGLGLTVTARRCRVALTRLR